MSMPCSARTAAYRLAALLFLAAAAHRAAPAQTAPAWRLLPAAPFLSSSRQDDAFFVTPERGWVANARGQIWKTTDGGGTWSRVYDRPTVYFRSIAFADSLRGWATNLGTEEFGGATDTNIIFQTTDGGAHWSVNDNFSPQKPRGLCGIRAVGDSCVYAVGRVRGPSFFVRSTDRGATWQTRNMSAYAYGLIDCHFFTPDSGIAVGHTGTVNETSSGVILFTSDRGTTWSVRHTTSRIGEWCWKIDFPTRRTGYVSLQRNAGAPVNFLKTTDGGVTWRELQLSTSNYYVQGIGFATETLGWVGGNSTFPTYQTTDGGLTWAPQPFGVRVNRFRMLNDTLGYAVGQGVYKYSRTPAVAVAEPAAQAMPEAMAVLEAWPNPFNAQTTLRYTIHGGADDPGTPLAVDLRLYDMTGREVRVLVREERRPGSYSVTLDAATLASGVYLAALTVGPGRDRAPMIPGRYTDTKKIVLLK
jgi:photosystem II stability/assembly factor-like uncharacterized protein